MSTDSQATADRNSLPVQQSAFETRCAERGWELVAVYTDVESGRKVGRTQYQKMLRAARAGEFDVLVVTFLDRFGRDEEELVWNVLSLKRMGVQIEAIYEDISAFDDMIRSAQYAQRESKRIGERVRLTQARAVSRGVPMGQTPFGYRREGSTFVPDEPNASLVRELFSLYLDGNRSTFALAVMLNERGIKPPRAPRWSQTAVRDLLMRRAYTGVLRWGEHENPHRHEALVDEDTFEAVQRRMAQKGAMPAGGTQRSEYLLSGLVYCGLCGGRMHGHTRALRQRRRTVGRGYICSNHRQYGTCELNYHTAETVEALVLADIADIFVSDERRQSRYTEESERMRAALNIVERELTKLPGRFRLVQQDREAGNYISDTQFRMANQNIEDDRQSLEAERARLVEQIGLADEAYGAARVAASIHPASDAFAAMDTPAKKAWLQACIERIVITPRAQPLVYPRVLLPTSSRLIYR